MAGKNLRISLGGHESFPFRDGWLKKGVDAIARDPLFFKRKDALVSLGVGANMVCAIRHWCLAAELVSEEGEEGANRLAVTPLGHSLIADGGWDPYLEDTASLWLLHWKISSNERRALMWHLVFTAYPEIEFSKSVILAFIRRNLERMQISTTDGVLQRELDCCLRTYLPARRKSGRSLMSAEESVDCPLLDLEVLRLTLSEGIYRFDSGPKPSLPVPVIGYALLDFWKSRAAYRNTLTVDECLYQQGSPGQAFKLDEASLIDALGELESLTCGKIRVQETAGLKQVYFQGFGHDGADPFSLELLGAHYV